MRYVSTINGIVVSISSHRTSEDGASVVQDTEVSVGEGVTIEIGGTISEEGVYTPPA